MKNTSIESERLLKLAKHLGNGRRLHEAVDTSSAPTSLCVNQNGELIRFYGFPFHECVHIFHEWTFSPQGFPVLGEISNASTIDSALAFFNLSIHSFQHLFSPHSQYIRLFGGKVLTKSSRRAIAFNIRSLVETGKINSKKTSH